MLKVVHSVLEWKESTNIDIEGSSYLQISPLHTVLAVIAPFQCCFPDFVTRTDEKHLLVIHEYESNAYV